MNITEMLSQTDTLYHNAARLQTSAAIPLEASDEEYLTGIAVRAREGDKT